MNNNQINGQKNNKEAYCPNPIFNNGTVSIGEFKTIEDAMNFPMQEIWCINRTQDNKFNSYVSQGCRLLIICDWGKSIQDSQKFVVALISKSGKITYWDLNDLPINTRQYENSIDNDVLTAIYAVADELYRNNNQLNCNLNMNKKQIRLTESDLKQIVKESVNRILKESFMHQDFWEPAAVISKEEILDVLDSWCLDNPQFEEAAKALQRMMYKAAEGRIDNRGKFIRKSDGTITDYEGNPVQRAVGDDDRYTRSQEMRDPFGGY